AGSCGGVGVCECIEAEAGAGAIVRHLGQAEPWERVIESAVRITRLEDVETGPWTALYQVLDTGERCRRYLVAEPARGVWAGELGHVVQAGSWMLIREGEQEETWQVV